MYVHNSVFKKLTVACIYLDNYTALIFFIITMKLLSLSFFQTLKTDSSKLFWPPVGI